MRTYRACSSVGRALRSQRRGHGFESHQVHKSEGSCKKSPVQGRQSIATRQKIAGLVIFLARVPFFGKRKRHQLVSAHGKNTKDIVEGGILTENYTDVHSNDDDGEQTIDFLLPDSSLNPESIYFKQELYNKLYEAYDSLEYTEKIMLTQHLGFCPECFSTRYTDKTDLDENGNPKEKPIKPLPYTDIATDHGFSDADTAKKVCEKAIEKIGFKLLYLLREQKDNDII